MKQILRSISIGLFAMSAVGAIAQGFDGPPPRSQGDGKVIRRLKLRHADPALVMLLLGGSQSTQIAPEISTVQKGSGNGGFGNSGFAGGSNRLGSQFGNGQTGSRSGYRGGSGDGGPGRSGRFGG